MAQTLIVINDPPYGTERAYNALRLGASLARQGSAGLHVFLIGDGVTCVKRGQKVPAGYYNIETMMKAVIQAGGHVAVCGSCMDARGIGDQEMVDGAHRGSMAELTAWTLEADKVLAF